MATQVRRGRRGAQSGTDEQEAADEQRPTDQAQEELDAAEGEGERPSECRIHRIDPEDGKQKFLAVAPPGQVNERYIQKKYGGGEYVTLTYGTRADGSFGFLKKTRRVYNIDSSIPFKGERGLSGPVRDREDSDDGVHMRTLRENQIIEMMKDQADSRQQTSMMMVTMMKGMAESSAAMVSAIANMASAANRAPADNGLLGIILPLILNKKDPVELATQIAALQKGGLSGLGDLETVLELAERIAKRTGGGEGEDVSVLGIIKDTLPKVVDLGQRYMDSRGTPAAPPTARAIASPAAPTPTHVNSGTPAAPPTTEAAAPVVKDEWTPLEPYIPHLIGFAQNDDPPADVAVTVLTMSPGPLKALLRETLVREDVVELFLKRFPDLQPYKTWFAQFIESLQVEMFGADDDDPNGGDGGEPAAVE